MNYAVANKANNPSVRLGEPFTYASHEATSWPLDNAKEENRLGVLIQKGLKSGLATAAETQACNELLGLAHAV